MNCAKWEERVALYAGGDLAAGEAARVERHLGECAACQLFASGMKQALETLCEAHGEIPAEAHFAAVRARVMERVNRKRRPMWAYAAAAAVAIFVALAIRLEWQPLPPDPVAVVRAPAPPAEAFVIPRGAAVAVRRPARAAVRSASTQPVLMKLVTDDPDVVIYWIAESKGD